MAKNVLFNCMKVYLGQNNNLLWNSITNNIKTKENISDLKTLPKKWNDTDTDTDTDKDLLIYNKIAVLKFETCRPSLLFSISYRLVLYEQGNVYDLQF